MIQGFEREPRRSSPTLHFNIIIIILTESDRRLDKVREIEEDLFDNIFDPIGFTLYLLDLLRNLFCLSQKERRILFFGSGFGNLLSHVVPLSPHCLSLLEELSPFIVQFEETVDLWDLVQRSSPSKVLLDEVRVFSNEFDI